MLSIVREIKSGFTQLFPGGRFRYVLVVLAMLAAVISVSELLVMKFFVNIVVQEGEIERDRFILLGAGLAIFFILTRVSQYYQRVYRVKAFARSFKSLRKLKKRGAKNPEWAMAFEVSNILTQATQLIAVLAFTLILEPIFAALNLLVVLVILAVIGRIFAKQLRVQQELQVERDGKRARPQKRYGTRIKAAELGSLLAGLGIALLLAVLLFMSYNGDISLANTLIIFFGTRLQNGSLTSTSRSLMRYAKAKAGAKSPDEDDE
jgi:ABC-type multidrug transport system fused ATPase/permease subunit